MAAETASAAAMPGQYTYPPAAGQSYFPMPFHLQYPHLVAQQYAATATPAIFTTATPANNTAEAYVYPMVAPVVPTSTYSLPQYQQAQQLFQRDQQMITPQALQNVKAAIASSDKVETKKKAVPRKAAGQTWEDPTLADWPENDFRLFCGDLGNEVNDDVLTKAFSRFPSFNMARVVRDKRTGKTKGYGFVSFANASDLYAALKEMNGKYVGNRPIKLRKSTWKERIDYEALQKKKSQPLQKPKLPKKGVLHK